LNTPVVAPSAPDTNYCVVDTSQEVNAKFLFRNGFYSFKSAEQKMAKIRKALSLKKVSVEAYCDFFKVDKMLFYGKR
jgi:hypothetical protein